MKRVASSVVAILTIFAATYWLAYLGSWPEPVYGTAPLAEWKRTVGLSLMGALAITASFIAIRKPKIAALLLCISAASLGLVLAVRLGNPNHLYEPHRPWAIDALPLLAIPGMFWLVTSRWLDWPPVLKSSPKVWKLAVCTVVILLLVVGQVVVREFDSKRYIYECHVIVQPSVKQREPAQVLFTASILRSGILWPRDRIDPVGYPRRYWALAVVRDHYWGLSWWNRKMVILTMYNQRDQNPFTPNQQYFVEGWRRPGALTSLLPIFETYCTRTALLQDAELDLRVLRDGPPKEGGRVIGRAARVTPGKQEPAIEVPVEIWGRTGKFVAVTDKRGYYDIAGIPPGEYGVTSEGRRHPQCYLSIRDRDVQECNVYLEQGSISETTH